MQEEQSTCIWQILLNFEVVDFCPLFEVVTVLWYFVYYASLERKALNIVSDDILSLNISTESNDGEQ